MRRKCVCIVFSLPLYISEGSHPNKYLKEGGGKKQNIFLLHVKYDSGLLLLLIFDFSQLECSI